ncbi:hypothetical protein R8Z50_25760 [Longispora sp. K20-0274]|uniref:hypothetical protein n=1 Tax=Longispora sp. K20-0274 TaxID=3088255 RepID=UPI00399C015B
MATQSDTTQGTAPVPEDGDSPVFVDPSGRRRGLVRLVGALVGGGLAVLLALLVAGLLGASPVTLPGWPGAEPARSEAPGTGSGTGAAPTPRPTAGRAATGGPGAPTPGHGTTAPTGAPPPTTVPTTNPGSDNRHVPTPKPSHGRP